MKTYAIHLKYIFILSFCFINTFVVSQDKQVVWVHGLGDATGEPGLNNNKSGWSERYAAEFERDRKIKSLVTNFKETTTSGVPEYANHVATEALYFHGDIGIGHSMGGLALREIDVNHPQGRSFKGIITFGAPLTGANIINDVPATSRFIENTSYNILRPLGWALPVLGVGTFFAGQYLIGALSTFGRNDLALGLMATGAVATIGGTLMNVAAGIPGPFIVRDLIANPVAEKLVEKKAPSSGKTKGHLSEASDYVHQFDHQATATPKIHIWGNESNPVTWNMLSSAIHVDLAKYVSIYADVCNALQYPLGWYITPVGYSFGEAYEFFKIDGRGNAQWAKDILHASHTQRNSYTYWKWSYVQNCYTESQTRSSQKCNRWGWFGWLCKAFTTIINVFKCVWSSVATLVVGYYDSEVIDRSDGTVTEWSAQGQYRPDLYGNRIQQAWNRGVPTIKADGVNHSEFRNHTEVTKIFKERIWNGGRYGYPDSRDIFAVEKRGGGY